MQRARERSGRAFWHTWWPSPVAIGAVVAAVLLFAIVSSLGNQLTSGGGIHFAHFEGEGFGFDYLDSWEVLSRYEHAGEHGPTVLAAVGVGGFDLGCTNTSDSVTCPASPRWTVPTDGVVLAYRFDAWLGPIAPQPTPSLGPGDEWVEVGGRGAILSRADTSMTWHFPGAPEYIEVRWGPDVSMTAPGQVQMAIDTWQWSPSPSPPAPSPSGTVSATPQPSVDIDGALVGDLALGAPCSWASGTDGIAWEIGQLGQLEDPPDYP